MFYAVVVDAGRGLFDNTGYETGGLKSTNLPQVFDNFGYSEVCLRTFMRTAPFK